MQAEQWRLAETFCWDPCDYTAKQVSLWRCDAAAYTDSNAESSLRFTHHYYLRQWGTVLPLAVHMSETSIMQKVFKRFF